MLLLFRIRRNRFIISVQKPVKPIKLPVQTLDQVFWFARAREVVIFVGKENDFGSHAEMFERAEPLLTLFDGHSIVVVRMKNKNRRLDVSGILQGRAVPVQIHFLKNIAAKIRTVSIRTIAGSIIGNKIGETA